MCLRFSSLAVYAVAFVSTCVNALCPASPCLRADHRSLGTPSELLIMEEDRVEGIDSMLTMDISTSMLAMDSSQPRRGCQGGGYALHRQSPE